MNVVLNSRVLIGVNHDAAEQLALQWRPEVWKVIEWVMSPSDLCVLRIDSNKDGKRKVRKPPPDMLKMANRLEVELRSRLDLPKNLP